MEMPQGLSVQNVVNYLGQNKTVECLHVPTQQSETMTLQQYLDYVSLKPQERPKIYNIITLEIGDSFLGSMIQRPRIVRDLDWVDTVWPHDLKTTHLEYPRVQLYCLMGVQDCYTDFHIDFGGTSVFYHIISGEKVFYFVEPTRTNLQLYERWSTSPEQMRTFFGDLVPECKRVHLKAGYTMIIPSGWIHAVFTPCDTMVIGGNFLHGMDMTGQIQIAEMEIRTNVPLRFRFPFFDKMQWYAARHYLQRIRQQDLSKRELHGLQSLLVYLGKISKTMVDFNKTKEERKQERKKLPQGIKNVNALLETLQLYVNHSLNGSPLPEFDSYQSDLSELEYLDSDVDHNELQYEEEEEAPLKHERESESDRDFLEEYSDDEKPEKPIKVKKERKPSKPRAKMPNLSMFDIEKSKFKMPQFDKPKIIQEQKPKKPVASVFKRLSKSLNKKR
ncbi:hypothetical protein EDD86DRAFT_209400 [Gorgonomyces haynaldii]|nr:hypothetical protein EDD86DRAFT_209400 [Gorgonomyces haynaldii]